MSAAFRAHGFDPVFLPIPLPVETAGFVRQPAHHPLFVYVGRLEPEKGVATLIEAFARLTSRHPEARLRIVGEGSLRRSLEHHAHSSTPTGTVDGPVVMGHACKLAPR